MHITIKPPEGAGEEMEIVCPFCNGTGGVLLLGAPSLMCCPICYGKGKTDESKREEAELLAAKRNGECILAIGVLLGMSAVVVVSAMVMIIRYFFF